ncbi:kelch-like protein [Corallococcus exiguus]|uniref:Kelch repeat-containing protein n=2 Tax=Corallococcus TaxID=83461 RepID=UPI000F889E86|nr:kelch repeat-containing protein [Corallococcus sp. AB018]NNC17309.1 kelch-like protein [Corallococcus exiguus]RUO88912.1 kelch-like protein [Corallococcus sp. AB018]
MSLKSPLPWLLSGLMLLSSGCDPTAAGSTAPHLAARSDDIVSGMETTGSMITPREGHTATLLLNGKVLVAGGYNYGQTPELLQVSELYDPATGNWTPSGSMTTQRWRHTATRLGNGKVLVVGGNSGTAATAELYDPATGTWTATANLPGLRRESHRAVLLGNGKVLVTGGSTEDQIHTAFSALYDPSTGTWSTTGDMRDGRSNHSLTLLKNGKILAVGGMGFSTVWPTLRSLSTAELYDPATGTWTLTGLMASDPIFLTPGRTEHSATLLPSGKVLVAGGYSASGFIDVSPPTVTAELYDPSTGTWSNTGSMAEGHSGNVMDALPSGKVVIAGKTWAANAGTVELYDPTTGAWSTVGTLANLRYGSTTTTLASGRVLIAGGQRYDSATSKTVYIAQAERVVLPYWKPAGNMATARFGLTGTLLGNGKVLTTGGFNGTTEVASADLRDPTTGAWSATGAMAMSRQFHAATLLSSGKVLVTGGYGNDAYRSSSELFNPTTATWTSTGGMNQPRLQPVSVKLANGKVLVAGGDTGLGYTASAELYDPTPGTWTSTGSMASARIHTTPALLPNGKVLIVGGYDGNVTLGTAELFDPATGTWSSAGTLAQAREGASATVLPNGKVLIAGGTAEYPLNTAELYDPATNTWSAAPTLTSWRTDHAAIKLANGDVMVAGGYGVNTGYGVDAYLDSVEVYESALGRWTRTTPLGTLRYAAEGVLLQDGQVLVMGGSDFDGPVSTTELYVP